MATRPEKKSLLTCFIQGCTTEQDTISTSQDSSIIYDSPIAVPSTRTLLGSVRLQVLCHTNLHIITLEGKLPTHLEETHISAQEKQQSSSEKPASSCVVIKTTQEDHKIYTRRFKDQARRPKNSYRASGKYSLENERIGATRTIFLWRIAERK